MTTNEIKRASYNELIERQTALIAHPEHDHRIAPELAAIDSALADHDLQAIYDKVDAEMQCGGLDWMMGDVA